MKDYRSLNKLLNHVWGNKKGFTLAEVMVAAGLVGILSLALVNIMSNLGKTSKKMQQDAELIQVKMYATRLLNKESACTRSLNGIALSVAGTNVPAGLFPNDVAPNAVFVAGRTLGQGASLMQIQSVEVQGFKDLGAAAPTFNLGANTTAWGVGVNARKRGTARLIITVEKGRAAVADDQKKKSSYGNIVVPIIVEIEVVTNNANVIQSCYGESSEYVEAACNALNGHLDDFGKCVEISLAADNIAGERVGPAIVAGSANSTDVTLTDAFSPLVVRNNGALTAVLKFDSDEIQAIAAAATSGTLNINTLGGTVNIGTQTENAVAVPSTVNVNGTFNANYNVALGANAGQNTIDIGDKSAVYNDIIDINGITAFENGSVTSNDAVNITLNSNSIILGNAAGDILETRGLIRNTTANNGGYVYVNDSLRVTSNTQIDGSEVVTGNSTVNTRIYLPNVAGTTTLSNKMVPNVEWIKTIIANTLAPAAGDVAGILTDIIANNTSNDTAANVMREYVCDAIRIRKKRSLVSSTNDQYWDVTNGGTGCNFALSDTNCSRQQTCSQVCIGTSCKTSWAVSVSQTSRSSCRYVGYNYASHNVNPSNSTAGSSGYYNNLCAANEMVNGVARRYLHFSSGSHGWRSYLYCCRPVIN